MTQIISWITTNYIELLGFLFGIIYVLLAMRQNIWCWLSGIINVSLYIIIFLHAKLYGDMALQIFYLVMSFYGWYNWLKKKNSKSASLIVSQINSKTTIILIIITPLAALLFGYILTFTPSDVPYWDGLTTALGLVATWMTAKKILENWLVWIFANILCVGIYYYKELYPTMIFYFVLAICAIAGYYQWKKELNINENLNTAEN